MNVNVAFNEKVQITPTFGDAETVYYFGKAPILFNLSGLLIDSIDNPWFTRFVEMYSHVIRGTELARNYELVELTLPNMIVIGSITSFQYNQTADRDTDILFTMVMHAKKVVPIPVTLAAAPLNEAAKLIDFGKAENFQSFRTVTDINSLKTKVTQLTDLVKNPYSTLTDAQTIFKSMGTLGDNLFNKASSLLNNAGATDFNKMLGSIGATGGHIGQAVQGAMDGAAPQLTKVASGVRGVLLEGITDAQIAIQQNLPDFTNAVSSAPGAFQEALKAAPLGFQNAVKNLPFFGEKTIPGIDAGFADVSGALTGKSDDSFDASFAESSQSSSDYNTASNNPLGSLGDRTLTAGSYLRKAGTFLSSGPSYIPGTKAGIFGEGGGFSDVATSVTAFRASLFSPVFGILTTITKVVKSVTGTIAGVISKFTEPINMILRDIRAITNQAVSVVNTIQASVNQLVNIPLRTINDVRRTITSIKRAAGVISRMPETIGSSIKRLVKSGNLMQSSPFLTSGGRKPRAKVPLLNSGRPYNALIGATIRG